MSQRMSFWWRMRMLDILSYQHSLQQIEKIIHFELRLFKNMSQCGTLDRAMRWDSYLEYGIGLVLLEPNMASFLSYNNPSISL